MYTFASIARKEQTRTGFEVTVQFKDGRSERGVTLVFPNNPTASKLQTAIDAGLVKLNAPDEPLQATIDRLTIERNQLSSRIAELEARR